MISPEALEDSRSSVECQGRTLTSEGLNVTVTVGSECDENISFPSSSSSSSTTPIPTTPTREIPKQTGSPIMRGLQNVLNMFRSSQGPEPTRDETSKPRGSSSGSKTQEQRHSSKEGSGRRQAPVESSDNSDSDLETDRPLPLAGSGRKRLSGVVIPAEGAYDPKKFQDLKVPPDIENIFQYIMKYTPQKIDIEFKLQPFVPDYVPSVGDIDAYIKVTTPLCDVKGDELTDNVHEFIDNLALSILDEPAAEQSDSALLHLQLRAVTKSNSAKANVVTKKIENAEKNVKSIERWIKDVSELHLTKPAPNVSMTVKMPDVDALMAEWPENMEDMLNDAGFPPSNLDCALSQYVDLICGLFDIPIVQDNLNDRIQALHCLFTLYSAVKNSQLYADRQKEEKNTDDNHV